MRKICKICGSQFETSNKIKKCCSMRCSGINRKQTTYECQKRYWKRLFEACKD